LLSTDEKKFCYNIESIVGEIVRLIDMNADEHRVCKKVYSVNSDFCRAKNATTVSEQMKSQGLSTTRRSQVGVIYI
jgi:hypothetical protein